MPERYTHLTNRDLDDAVLKANGIKPPDDELPVVFEPRICPVCKTPNDPTYPLCANCSTDLTGASASVDDLIGTMSKVLDTSLLTKEIDDIIQDIGKKHPDGLVDGHIIEGNEAIMFRTLIGLGAVSQKITQGLVALSRGAKQLDAAAELEATKKIKKPRARA